MQNIKINMTSKKAFNHKSRQTVPSQSHCNFSEKKQTFPCCLKLCIKMHTEKVNVRTCRGLAWQKKRLETGWDGDKWSDLRQIEKDKAQKQKSVGAYNSHLFKNIFGHIHIKRWSKQHTENPFSHLYVWMTRWEEEVYESAANANSNPFFLFKKCDVLLTCPSCTYFPPCDTWGRLKRALFSDIYSIIL